MRDQLLKWLPLWGKYRFSDGLTIAPIPFPFPTTEWHNNHWNVQGKVGGEWVLAHQLSGRCVEYLSTPYTCANFLTHHWGCLSNWSIRSMKVMAQTGALQHIGGGAVGEGRRPEDTSGFEKPMKFSGGSDRLVEVVEPRGRSRIGILEDGEELTSAWPPGQTLSDATQTTEDEEATLRELLMRYTFKSLPPSHKSQQ